MKAGRPQLPDDAYSHGHTGKHALSMGGPHVLFPWWKHPESAHPATSHEFDQELDGDESIQAFARRPVKRKSKDPYYSEKIDKPRYESRHNPDFIAAPTSRLMPYRATA